MFRKKHCHRLGFSTTTEPNRIGLKFGASGYFWKASDHSITVAYRSCCISTFSTDRKLASLDSVPAYRHCIHFWMWSRILCHRETCRASAAAKHFWCARAAAAAAWKIASEFKTAGLYTSFPRGALTVLPKLKITINRSASRASINRIRSELGEAQARDNVHALELVEDEFTCVRNLDRGHVAVGPAVLAPAGVANESALVANMAQEFVCGRKMVAI